MEKINSLFIKSNLHRRVRSSDRTFHISLIPKVSLGTTKQANMAQRSITHPGSQNLFGNYPVSRFGLHIPNRSLGTSVVEPLVPKIFLGTTEQANMAFTFPTGVWERAGKQHWFPKSLWELYCGIPISHPSKRLGTSERGSK